MKLPIRPLSLACAALGSLASLQAADFIQVATAPFGSNWNDASLWQDGLAPTAGNNYITQPFGTTATAFVTNGVTWAFAGALRDANNISSTFDGGTLTLASNTRLLGKVENGGTASANIIFDGGFFFAGPNAAGSATLAGTIGFGSGGIGAIGINPNSPTALFAQTVSSTVIGDTGDTLQLTLFSENAAPDTGTRLGQLIFNGDITGFGGTLYVGTSASGTNAASFYSVQSSSTSTTLQLDYEAGNNFLYNLATDETFGSLVVGSTTLGEGTYHADDLNAFGTGTHFFGEGSITVVPEPSVFALLGAAGAAAFVSGRLRRRS